MRDSNGFTLVELLIVIVIVGLLSAIAIPTFIGQVWKAEETAAKQALRYFNEKQKLYYLSNREFADSYKALNYQPEAEEYKFTKPQIFSGGRRVRVVAKYQGDGNNGNLIGYTRVTPRGMDSDVRDPGK